MRAFDERWLDVADISGDPEIGLGATVREALAASLATLGDRVATRPHG